MPGFYWGDNNSKDLQVNLENAPDPQGEPSYIPYVPGTRDLAWMELYKANRGRIDEQFGFTAFDSAPLVASSTIDAKIATSDMANHMLVWAAFGRPNESIAPPRDTNYGIFPGGYHLFTAARPAAVSIITQSAETQPEKRKAEPVSWKDKGDQLWKGWLLPASDADIWFVAGSAAYWRLLQSPDVNEAMEVQEIRYRGLKLSPDNAANRFRLEQAAGSLFLDSIRRKIGDNAFLKLMNSYYSANTTKTVTAESFLRVAGVKYEVLDPGDGPAYLPGDINRRLASTAIVYGTAGEAGTNRYVAEQLQARYRDNNQQDVPVYKDFETNDGLLSKKDVVFVGRPEDNSALAAWIDQIGLDYRGAVFKVAGKTYASERNALVFAAKNPADATHMVLVYAGNSPLETARSIGAAGDKTTIILYDGKPAQHDGGQRD